MVTSREPGEISRRAFVGTAAAAAVVGAASDGAQRKAVSGPLRVAQIGVEGHFGDVMSGIPKIEDCRLVAAARSWPEDNIKRLGKTPAWTRETKLYDDYRKMLDEVKPDIVAVFAPFARNGEVNVEAARRGCHVFSEKPIATSMADLDALRAERDKHKIRVTAMLPMRTAPAFVAAYEAVKKGRIGEPILISAQKSYRFGTSRPWYYKHRKDYGGSIPWVSIHAIDFIRYVSGLDYASVTARQAVKGHPDYPECEDCGALLFEMKNGGQATLTFDYFRPAKAPSHGDDRLRVVGTEGIVEVRLTDKTFCELITNSAGPEQLAQPDSQVNMFVDFVTELRGGKPHVLSPEDPFRATEVAIKGRESADGKSTIQL
ncbi:MAG: Gfo/Idh/MocA family oxidoreductase [Phycisphaerae bacterium]|nr:Gfo/Idh/MocA family oxidoreductase [Phycisphaerae bacterium]